MSAVVLQPTAQDAGQRLDVYLARHFPEDSRARIQQWIASGRVEVNGDSAPRSSLRLKGGERIEVEPVPAEPLRAFAEDIPLTILYEDEHFAAIDKPAGLSVHAGAGRREGTLVNALLHRFHSLSGVSGELRPGLVHRLDRFTSGVVLVAKDDRTHRLLARQFERRQVRKLYCAIVHGRAPAEPSRERLPRGRWVQSEGRWWIRIEAPIGRDSRHRARMAIRSGGREAITQFRPLRANDRYSFLEIEIGTGRTHQIRVHLAAFGRPVVGDRLYGAPSAPPELPAAERYYLHARHIEFQHPVSGAPMFAEAPLPDDFTAALSALGL